MIVVYILSSIVGFEFDESPVIVDNSDNGNIWSEEEIFADKIDPIIYNGLGTIGRKYPITKGFETVIWYWTGDEGQIHTNKLKNVI